MHKRHAAASLCLSSICLLTLGSAAEIQGSVSSVDGQLITIIISSDLLPAVGDKLDVFVEVRGVGLASVASATVSSVEDQIIRAKIDKATGTVKVGQSVTIQSPKPVRRGGVTVPAVIGMLAADAKTAIEQAGLAVTLLVGDAAPPNSRPFTVYAQDPASGRKVAKGSSVTLRLYGQPSLPSETASGNTASGLERWGTVIDPDGDCTITAESGKLTMHLSAGHHTVWYGRGGLFNAPRVLQNVTGDFVAQVKVTADLDTGVRLPEGFFNSAGLLVWESEKQYLRLERNWFNNPNYGTLSFTTPLYDHDDQRVNGWKVASPAFFRGRSTWLRIERTGKIFTTYISHDGRQWSPTGVLATEFPDSVRVGVLANNRPREFSAEFEEFTITRGQPASTAAASSLPAAGWGNIIDPDDDCVVVQSPTRLKITIPAGVHDYWYGRKLFNAPRALQEVEGDFELQVKVSADWTAEARNDGKWAIAAGLIVLESEDHYLRVERNRFVNNGTWSWLPPIYDRDEKRLSTWRSYQDGRPFQGRSTWLRIQRTGQTLTTAISHDGRTWTDTTSVPTTFPKKVQVGLLAINYSAGAFVAEFEKYRLEQ